MTQEIIEKIEDYSTLLDKFQGMDGYRITTNKQEILLSIDNEECCCERWGHFFTNDDYKSFIGATILDIKLVTDCLNEHKAPDVYEGDVMFVNIETDRGTLQFTAYNSHNGYYGHWATVKSTQLDHETRL